MSVRTIPDAERVIVALDVPAERMRPLADALAEVPIVKVGLEAYVREGADLVRALTRRGHGVFLDLKLHDIPNTVARATREVAALGVRFLTLHASGGPAMMEAAVAAAREVDPSLVCLGVTVLTSLSGDELPGVWDPRTSVAEKVAHLARVAVGAGAGGVVASPLEAAALRRALGPEPLLVCPGIRPPGAAPSDQRRTATPREALAAGADYLVVGRPITGAADPAEAHRALLGEIRTA